MAETNKKMTTCKHCGAVIAKNAKSCPQCGGKNKKPVYKRVWFIILMVFLVLGIIGSVGGGEDTADVPASGQTDTSAPDQTESAEPEEPAVEYIPVDVGTMMDTLESNALKAAKTYEDQYVTITGKLNVIDASGEYISIVDGNNQFAIIGVSCYIKNDEQLDAVAEMSVGDTVTVSGQIFEVGEVFGYYMNIDSIG